MTNQPTPDLMQQAAGRWLVALMLLQNEIGPITLEEQTAMLNKEMPPEDRISSVQYSRVNNGLRPVRPREALALARICQRHGVEIDPGWIIFGEHSDAPSPDSPLAEAAQLILPGTRRISPRGKRGESKPTRRQTRKPKE